MPFACGLLPPDDRAAGRVRQLDARPPPCGSASRARARTSSRPRGSHGRPVRLRAVLVPPARVDGGQAAAFRERACVRRPGAQLRCSRERLRRASAGYRDGRSASRDAGSRAGHGAAKGVRGAHARHPRSGAASRLHRVGSRRSGWLAGWRCCRWWLARRYRWRAPQTGRFVPTASQRVSDGRGGGHAVSSSMRRCRRRFAPWSARKRASRRRGVSIRAREQRSRDGDRHRSGRGCRNQREQDRGKSVGEIVSSTVREVVRPRSTQRFRRSRR